MGIQDIIRDRITGVSQSLARSLGADFGADIKLEAIGSEISTLQKQMIAQERERASAAGERPNLENLRKNLEAFGKNTDEGRQLVEQGKWNPKSYANFNGQDLSGFAISEPSKQTDGKRATTDLMDQDGDRAINDFYTNISFFEANLNNAYVDPATSFNEEVSKAQHLDNLTFNGMREGDVFRFNKGEFTNTKLTGVEGGEVIFGRGAIVDGIEFEGKSAKVYVEGGARVEHIKGNKHFSIIKFDTQEGAVIANSDLTSLNISMASNIEGCEFNNVQFGSNLEGLEFKKGCVLKNVSVNGKPIENAQELKKYGAEVDESVTAQVSTDFRKQCAMDLIRKTERGLVDAGAVLSSAERFTATTDMGALNEAPAIQPEKPAAIAAPTKPTPANTLAELGAILRGAEQTVAEITQSVQPTELFEAQITDIATRAKAEQPAQAPVAPTRFAFEEYGPGEAPNPGRAVAEMPATKSEDLGRSV